MGKGSRTRSAGAPQQAARTSEKTSIGIKLAFVGVALLCLIALVYYIITGTGLLQRNMTALEVGDESFSASYMNICYRNARASVLSQYGSTLASYGYPTDSTLDAYTCIFDTTISFREYFMDQAEAQAKQMMVLYQEGKAAGFEPEDPEGYADSLATLKEQAESNDMSLKQYLQAAYGKSVTEDVIESFYKLSYYTSSYYDSIYNSKDYTDAEIDAYYKENADDYDVIDFYSYAFSYTKYTYTAPKDGETVEEGQPTSEEEATQMTEAAQKEAQEKAAEMVARVEKGEDFDTVAKEYFVGSGKKAEDFTTKYNEGKTVSTLSGATGTWLTDSKRTANEIAVVEDTSNTQYVVIRFQTRRLSDTQAASVRHILFLYESAGTDATDEEKEKITAANAEKKAAADKLLADWKAGEATEDSFAALAEEHSEDTGSNTDGGLYQHFPEGQMVDEFNEWSFDAARKAGDTAVIETSYGAHVMYYVSADGDYYRYRIEDTLKSDAYDAWYKTAAAKYDVSSHNFAMSLVNQ